MPTAGLARWVKRRLGRLAPGAGGGGTRPSEAAEVEAREPVELPPVLPWHAAAEVADDVGSVLGSLDIDHWTVNALQTRTTIWAIRDRDWPELISALVSRLGDRGYSVRSGETVLPLRAGFDADALGEPSNVTIFRPLLDRSPDQVSNRAAACEIQLWTTTPRGTLRTSEKSGVIHEMPDGARIDTVPVHRWDGVAVPRPAALGAADGSEIDFEVDAVYLWVDGSDPAWRARRDEARQRDGLADSGWATAANRFRDRGELRASFRSLEMYAPWIRRIFLVTDRQRPDWLDPDADRVTVVDHRDIFADPAVLPSFNSHAIGSQLHRVEGLASRYLVINDDVLFNRAVTPYDFFTPEGLLKVIQSRSRRANLDPEKLSVLERARHNSAQLIERDLGRRMTRLFAHGPIPQSLEMAREVADLYAAEIAQTLSHPFRSPDDYEVNAWLHLNRALLTGRALVTTLPFAYLDVGLASTRAMMEDPVRTRRAFFMCVNDVQPDEAEEASAWLADWLNRRFPVPTEYELDGN